MTGPYRVVLTDGDRFPLSGANLTLLESVGAVLSFTRFGTPEPELIEVCREADAILVNSARITRAVVESLGQCKLIAYSGIGYNGIDVQAAKERGIPVTYVPGFCMEEVSDHAVGLLLDIWRRITFSNNLVKGGRWATYRETGAMHRLTNKTVGLLGFGRIGGAVVRKLRGFGVRFCAHDPYVQPRVLEAAGVTPVSFPELLQCADILSLHAPLTAETRHIFNADAFALIKPGVILINTGRGALIDESALIEALRSGRVQAAGLDVLESEPPKPDNPLLQMAQVLITPHSAANSDEALEEVASRAVAEVRRALTGQPLECLVPELLKP